MVASTEVDVDQVSLGWTLNEQVSPAEWWIERLSAEREVIASLLADRHQWLLQEWCEYCKGFQRDVGSQEESMGVSSPCQNAKVATQDAMSACFVEAPARNHNVRQEPENMTKPFGASSASKLSGFSLPRSGQLETHPEKTDALKKSRSCKTIATGDTADADSMKNGSTEETLIDGKTWFENDALTSHVQVRQFDYKSEEPEQTVAAHRLHTLSGDQIDQAPQTFSLWAALTEGETYQGDWFTLQAITWLVKSHQFELVFCMLIAMNCVVMSVETQYQGLETGYREGFPGFKRSADESWPGAAVAFTFLEMGFGCLFSLELCLKLVGLHRRFVFSFWNWFDAFIVIFWLFSKFGLHGLNPMTLRLLRLVRLLRIFRLTRMFAIFDVLHLLVGSIKASGMVLLWSLVFLLLMMTMVALLLSTGLGIYIDRDANPKAKRYEVYQYFGTFSRSMVTMWEITLGNWVPVCRMLMEEVSEYFTFFFMVWQPVVGFAMITVIRGVFLHETFKVAQTDEELMILQKTRLMQKHRKQMKNFFKMADQSGDGFLTFEEFFRLSKEPKMKTWMAAMELEVRDANIFFSMMDKGNGKISVDELVDGFARLKGAAKSADLVHLMHMMREVQYSIFALKRMLKRSRTYPSL